MRRSVDFVRFILILKKCGCIILSGKCCFACFIIHGNTIHIVLITHIILSRINKHKKYINLFDKYKNLLFFICQKLRWRTLFGGRN